MRTPYYYPGESFTTRWAEPAEVTMSYELFEVLNKAQGMAGMSFEGVVVLVPHGTDIKTGTARDVTFRVV